jgi:hypothetical protein
MKIWNDEGKDEQEGRTKKKKELEGKELENEQSE